MRTFKTLRGVRQRRKRSRRAEPTAAKAGRALWRSDMRRPRALVAAATAAFLLSVGTANAAVNMQVSPSCIKPYPANSAQTTVSISGAPPGDQFTVGIGAVGGTGDIGQTLVVGTFPASGAVGFTWSPNLYQSGPEGAEFGISLYDDTTNASLASQLIVASNECVYPTPGEYPPPTFTGLQLAASSPDYGTVSGDNIAVGGSQYVTQTFTATTTGALSRVLLQLWRGDPPAI